MPKHERGEGKMPTLLFSPYSRRPENISDFLRASFARMAGRSFREKYALAREVSRLVCG